MYQDIFVIELIDGQYTDHRVLKGTKKHADNYSYVWITHTGGWAEDRFVKVYTLAEWVLSSLLPSQELTSLDQ